MGRRATAGGPRLHECPHVVDRPDGAGQIAIDQIVGEQGDRRRIVDLRQDELEGWRLERDRDDAVTVGHRREIGRRGVRLGRVAHVLGDAEEQVVLGLARDQEVPGRGEEDHRRRCISAAPRTEHTGRADGHLIASSAIDGLRQDDSTA